MALPQHLRLQLGSVVALTDGQLTALDQIERIARTDRAPISISGHNNEGSSLSIDVRLDCRGYERLDGGLPLHDWEGLTISVPTDFPFKPPSVTTAHTRFLGHSHVQWGFYLCLYQSTETQWKPSDGMFGFLTQLDEWFRRGARNELDMPEGPLHPPVAYPVAPVSICINADTPSRENWTWFGAALLEKKNPGLIEVNGWAPVNNLEDNQQFAPVILLDFELSFEYPRTTRYLFRYLENRGIESSQFLVHLMLASTRLPIGEPMYVGIGAPSRGVAGDPTKRQQHLTFWEIESEDVAKLRAASTACSVSNAYKGQETPEALQQLINDVIEDLFKWQDEAKVRWCSLLENREQIVTRRDEGTPMDWFRGKRIALWGCGALGGQIAEHLARAGVARLCLYDHGSVTPGILVRQNFSNADINEPKANALARRIEAIAPRVEAIPKVEDLVGNTLISNVWSQDFDGIIDATASLAVRSKLESKLKEQSVGVPIASVMISAAASHSLTVVTPPGYGAGPLDAMRRLSLAAMNRDGLMKSVDAFWNNDGTESLRQPEPGCSDPTFIASHADVANLAAEALNRIAKAIDAANEDAIGILRNRQDDKVRSFRFSPDYRWHAGGIDFRMSANAWRDVSGWIRNSARIRSPEHETGGLLFGQFDEALGIAWISNVSGPPKDSTFSPEQFMCGIDGAADLCQDYERRSRGVIQYLGSWHSHPVSKALPSSTDYAGISTLFAAAPRDGAMQLMLIVGFASNENAELGAYIFEKRALSEHQGDVEMEMQVRGGVAPAPRIERLKQSIGLALSGGGSRAVAFHLGTLRALDDLDLLDEVNVISGVSGGSLMTGIVGYSNAPFRDVDEKTVSFLRTGLVRPALRKLVNPKRLMPLIWNVIVVSIPTLLMEILSGFVSRLAGVLPGIRPISDVISKCHWPLRRRYSRTHVMADVIEDIVGSHTCDAETRQGKNIVFNACELRTGTAFRMSNEMFGSWRFGWAPAGEIRLADAIAASAAYPALLPPFDWYRKFEKTGVIKKQRVIITDGGVFENLGISLMEPGRNPAFSSINYKPEILIASDAGAGQFTGEDLPSTLPSRMVQVVSAVMRKVQDATKARLHNYAHTGEIARFVYVGLGQIDHRVYLKPASWVCREEVISYPTDFSSMSEENIRKLSDRGEAITRALATQYLLSD